MADLDNNTVKMLTAYVAPLQKAEDTLMAILDQLDIEHAVGAQLDIIGVKVGQPRNGLDDPTYRRFLRARIATNRSNGRAEDVLLVASLVVFDSTAYYQLDNQGNAGFVLRITNLSISDVLADILISFLRQSVAGGVRVVLETAPTPPETCFRWDTPGRGWDSGAPFLAARDH